MAVQNKVCQPERSVELSVISQFDGPMIELDDGLGAITEREHRRRFGNRRGPVHIVDGHQEHEHERREF